jgi:hypothetical protein
MQGELTAVHPWIQEITILLPRQVQWENIWLAAV